MRILIAAALFVATAIAAPATTHANDFGYLDGTVTDINAVPIPGIQVWMCIPGGASCSILTTDGIGYYAINDTQYIEGDYTVHFVDPDDEFITEYYDNVPDEASAAVLDLTNNARVTADAVLERRGSLSGVVTDNDGTPLEGIGVHALGMTAGSSNSGKTTTASDGTYSIDKLLPGDYTVSFNRCCVNPVNPDYRVEFYDDTDIATPDLVAVSADTNTPDIDAALFEFPQISGVVTDENGPLGGQNVALYNVDGSYVTNTGTASDGTFTLRPDAGEYHVYFGGDQTYIAEYWDDERFRADATSIEVMEGDVVGGIDAELAKYGSISGTVTDPLGNPVVGHNVSANGSGATGGAVTDGNGDYLIEGLRPGIDYRVAFFGGAYFTEYYDDVEAPLGATLVEVLNGAETTGIDAQVALGTSITGTVTSAVPGAIRVTAAGPDGNETAFTNGAGEYEFIGLKPGGYTIRFSDDNDVLAAEYYDDAAGAESATVVAATGGFITDIDAHLDVQATIAGTVLEGGEPSSGAIVWACTAADVCPYFAGVETDGTYLIDEMKPGEYLIRFESYDRQWADEYWPSATKLTDAEPVVADGDILGIDADLAVGGSISGFVSDSTGRGMFATEAVITACSDTIGWCESLPAGHFGFQPGEYTIGHLQPADDYIVMFEATWEPVPRHDEWWCDATDEGNALPVAVMAGVDTADIDASLQDEGTPDHDTCDADGDGVDDPIDNCPALANADQADLDDDGAGDVCDTDDDDDGVDDPVDNCPTVDNADQADLDDDGTGNACDTVNDNAAFESLNPQRFADSRDASTFDSQFRDTGPRAPDSTWEIDIAGRGGVPEDAVAAIVNVTLLNGSGPGFATVYPCGAIPNASSVNYDVGTVEPNEVIAKLSDAGTLCVYTLTQADVIVDVVGFVDANSPYAPLAPTRYADSRNSDTFDGNERDTGIRQGGTVWEIPVAGRGDVPATAQTIVTNVTITGGTGPGFATVYPCADDVPDASSLNYDVGVTIPNELVTRLSDDGAICVFTLTDAHVIVDVVGYLDDVPGYTSISPTRYADSRDANTFDNSFRDTGIRGAASTWEIQVAGRGVVPSNATTAALNLTVTGAAGPGFATVYPCTDEVPDASSLNYGPGTTRPNELIAALSDSGTVCIYTFAPTHVIVDVTGHNGT